ncbi:MAG: ribulose-phosphate 3-epimerase [Clostridia bacterium]
MKIAPSMLASNYAFFKEELDKITNADYIHLDVMDGHFVPNISFGAGIIKSMKPHTNVPFDVHLMISQPLKYLSDFKNAGADILCFHIECDDDTNEVIDKIIELDMKPAIAVKPNTPIETVYPFLDKLFMVLVMTVEPGFGGQSFMPEQMKKVKALKAVAPEILVEVDGGIGRATIDICKASGVDIAVAGTSVFSAENPNDEIVFLQNIGE